jgi:hypothetical protein
MLQQYKTENIKITHPRTIPRLSSSLDKECIQSMELTWCDTHEKGLCVLRDTDMLNMIQQYAVVRASAGAI